MEHSLPHADTIDSAPGAPNLPASTNLETQPDDVWDGSNLNPRPKVVGGIKPFVSLKMPARLDVTLEQAAKRCGIPASAICNIYPPTTFQEDVMAVSTKVPGSFMSQYIKRLEPSIDVSRFRRAWNSVAQRNSILRTALVHADDTLYQVVVRDIQWHIVEDDTIDSYLELDRTSPIGLGDSLTRYAVIHDPSTKSPTFVWTVHHAAYDHRSISLLCKDLERAYHDDVSTEVLSRPDFIMFVELERKLFQESWEIFWRENLLHAAPPSFPAGSAMVPDKSISRIMHYDPQIPTGIALDTIIKAAWALVLAQYEASPDVVFGIICSGRTMNPVSDWNVDAVIGPTIATVPFRVNLDSSTATEALFDQIRRTTHALVPFEQTGLRKIRTVSDDARFACSFRSLLVIQDPSNDGTNGFTMDRLEGSFQHLMSHPLTIEFIPKQGSSLQVNAAYQSSCISPKQIMILLDQFEHVLDQLLGARADTCVGDITYIPPEHEILLQKWNHKLCEPVISQCLPDLLDNRSLSMYPDRLAISAWDGDLSYGDLDRLSSRVASALIVRGIGPECFVPVCFEKSLWAVVSMLAVLKAGGVVVAIDPAYPMARRQSILQEMSPKIVLVSAQNAQAFKGLVDETMTISESEVHSLPPPSSSGDSSQHLRPHNAAFVVFTSGSTGKPKGIVIEHQAICTSLLAHGSYMKLGPESRVFQFAAYTFDVSMSDIFGTLLFGGRVCIPSDKDRLENLAGAMRHFHVNQACITSTVASLIKPNDVPSLKLLAIGGEMVAKHVVETWAEHVEMINIYGPAECSVWCAGKAGLTKAADPTCIGRGIGSSLWICDSADHRKLAPVEVVGELLVEGPLLARGYLNDPAITASSFITNLPWAKGNSRRFYKTGDLARYSADGQVHIVGRNDTQVKVRGQRTEIGEIEEQLKLCLPQASQVVVEQIPADDETNTLIAFIAQGGDTNQEVNMSYSLRNDLQQTLPSYMVPSLFIPISEVPLSTSGKSDRKKLRDMAGALSMSELIAMSATVDEGRRPSSVAEVAVEKLWSAILDISGRRISAEDNFFNLGGDSVSAMRLVAAAWKVGYGLSVADIFNHPVLADMALVAVPVSFDSIASEPPLPFSLLDHGMYNKSLIQQVAERCSVANDQVVDTYPCTPLQEGLMALSAKQSGSYIGQFFFSLPASVDPDRFANAWNHLIEATPIMRSCIVSAESGTFLQVVLREDVICCNQTAGALNMYIEHEKSVSIGLGDPLMRFSLVQDAETGVASFLWTAHHASYDAHSIRQTINDVEAIYKSQLSPKRSPFNSFIRYIRQSQPTDTVDFWRRQLDNCPVPWFPQLPDADYNAVSTEYVAHSFKLSKPKGSNITTATLLRASWALLLTKYENSEDVVFGTVVNGRQQPLPNIETMIAPTFATLPVHICARNTLSIKTFLAQVQQQAVDMIPYGQTGLQTISGISPEIQASCVLRTLMLVQESEGVEQALLNSELGLAKLWIRQGELLTYPLGVECTIGRHTDMVSVRITFDPAVLAQSEAARLGMQLEYVAQQIAAQSTSDITLGQLDCISSNDLELICSWNSETPEEIVDLLHNGFLRQVQINPDRSAICTSECEITYRELDSLSTMLGIHLRERGIMAGVGVPLCFEKTPLAIISMLGILKAGGYFIPMDPSQPEERLRGMCDAARAPIVLVSAETALLFQTSPPGTTVTVTDPWLKSLPHPKSTDKLTGMDGSASPDSLAYAIFTSGSTGTPKGVCIQHKAICSSIKAHEPRLGFSDIPRTLQFASFAFDVTVAEIFTTLSNGGCICLPSDAQRQNDIVAAMKKFRVTVACFTPALIEGLRLETVPTLKTLIVGGDKITRRIVENWSQKLRLVNGYGPTEASVLSLLCHISSPNHRPGVIGTACGCISWVVEPTDASRLAPIGAIGELLLQGPILAQEYLGDPEKTQAAFISQPPFFLGSKERQDRFYKTGDLVRYMPDGSLEFLGRKDSQVKIRGQRVEIGEIEARIRRAVGPEISAIAVQVVTHKDRNDSQVVAAYLCYHDARSDSSGSQSPMPLFIDQYFKNYLGKLKAQLMKVLPSYMVPSLFIPLRRFPYSTAGKIDSKALHCIINKMSLEELTVYSLVSNVKKPASSSMERDLQRLWAATLNISTEAIGVDDSFFQLGGDSISSTHLAAMAQREQIDLPVQDIFKHPTLGAMSSVARRSANHENPVIKPFSLVPTNTDTNQLIREAAAQCGVDVEHVIDMYPCTPLQDGFMTLSIKEPSFGMAQFVWLLPEMLDVGRFQSAWTTVVSNTPILRSRITQTSSAAIMTQVVLRDDVGSVHWRQGLGLDAYLATDLADSMVLGKALVRLAIIRDRKTENEEERVYFVLTIHHSMYDGWMLGLLMRDVETLYSGRQVTAAPSQFNSFIKHLTSQDTSISERYWATQLDGALLPTFPELPSMTYRSQPDDEMTLSFPVPPNQAHGSDITISTKLRAAWALLLSRYSDEDDVVFASTLNGRTVPVPFIDMVVGPALTTVPIRVSIGVHKSIGEYLISVQEQGIDMMAHEQFGQQNIRRISPECNAACQFRSLLLIQRPQDAEKASGTSLGLQIINRGVSNFHTYPLAMECILDKDNIEFKAIFDRQVIDPRQMRRILHQLTHVFSQLDNTEMIVKDINWMSPYDIEELAGWNSKAPEPTERCVHNLVQDRIDDNADEPALCSWEGELTYRQMDDLAARLACELISRGIRRGVLVPLLFEKSIWAVITMLAVLRSGGANVAMDPAHPEERLHGIVQEVEGHLIISDQKCSGKAGKLLGNVLVVDRQMLQSLQPKVLRQLNHEGPAPSSPAFILFTSGSTGKPKGIVITHTAFSSSIRGHAEVLRYRKGSRNLQFTAYTSDVSIGEIFTSLSVGACVCVPSDYERMNGIAASMERMRVDWAFFTPSVASLLKPDDVPSLKVLVYGGETATPENISMWAQKLYLINSFGPAECSIWTHCNPGCSVSDVGSNIGYAIGCLTWIVDVDDYHKLAPIGTIGELVIEGPNVAQGYLKDEAKTAASFIENPAWMRNDDRRRRLYRLGDLARYLPDGKVQFMGRRDAQVKLRGQRIELGEIEYQIRELIPGLKESAVEMVKLAGPRATNLLAAFMTLDVPEDALPSTTTSGTIATAPELVNRFREMTKGLDTQLGRRIPHHMIPTLYIPLLRMPLTASAKTDRKKLRHMASLIPEQDMGQFTLTRQNRVPVSTKMERQLQQLWAKTLNVDPESITADDTFFDIGGDSLAAMRLVALAGGAGWDLSVRIIFQHPSLKDMAQVVKPVDDSSYFVTDQAAFSLLPQEAVGDILADIAAQCGVDQSRIQDAYPCTALQEGMLAISMREPNTYVAQFVFSIAPTTNLDQLQRAYFAFIHQTPMMRTRIVRPALAKGMVQVVLDEEPVWVTSSELSDYLRRDIEDIMGPGTPLIRIAIVNDPTEGRLVVFTAHHAVFDHYSMLMFYESLWQNYQAMGASASSPPPSQPSFNRFIKHIQEQDREAAKEFWRKELHGAPRETFPGPPVVRSHLPHFASRCKFRIPGSGPAGITHPTIITAALALTQATYLNSTDIVVGTTLSGRGVALDGIDSLPGPTLTTMPVRVFFDKTDHVFDFLSSVQNKYAQITEFESFGLQNIRRVSADAETACNFQNMIFVQTQPEPPQESDFLGFKRLMGNPMAFGSVPLMMEADVVGGHIDIYMAAHPDVLSELQSNRLLDLLKHFIVQLYQADPETEIRHLQHLTTRDINDLVAWNTPAEVTPAKVAASPVYHAIEELMSTQPTTPAIICPDTCITYAELDSLSAAVDSILQEQGVEVGMTVALCSKPSVAAVASTLSILRAGRVLLFLDPTILKHQQLEILQRHSPKALFVSPETEGLFADAGNTHLEVMTDKWQASLRGRGRSSFKAVPVTTDDIACYLVTKTDYREENASVTLKHGQLCHSLQNIASGLGVSDETRMLPSCQNSSYVSYISMLVTLMQGGCVCIPPTNETDMAKAISKSAANTAILEQSALATMAPGDTPSLKTVVVVGKSCSSDIISAWSHRVNLMGAYGSPETSAFSLFHRHLSSEQSSTTIGRPLGCSTWVVDPDGHDKLVPIGAIGELLIEGPAVAEGYFHAPELDDAAFVLDTKFGKNSVSPCRAFKTGDLVRYNSKANLEFVRRKDSRHVSSEGTSRTDNVKEVIMSWSQGIVTDCVVEDVIHNCQSSLAAFIVLKLNEQNDTAEDGTVVLEMTPKMHYQSKRLAEYLSNTLPSSAVPTVYIPLKFLPNISDRQLLVQSAPPEMLKAWAGEKSDRKVMPTTEHEGQLQQLWATVFEKSKDEIGIDDNFFHLGGDSLGKGHTYMKRLSSLTTPLQTQCRSR